MNKVYIVIGVDAGGSDIVKVFDSKIKAAEFNSDILNEELDGYTYTTIQEYEVE